MLENRNGFPKAVVFPMSLPLSNSRSWSQTLGGRHAFWGDPWRNRSPTCPGGVLLTRRVLAVSDRYSNGLNLLLLSTDHGDGSCEAAKRPVQGGLAPAFSSFVET